MTDRNLKRSALVGLAVTFVLVSITMSIGALNIFKNEQTIRAVFGGAAGLESGDPVRVAGVDVGSVSGIERLSKDGAVAVDLKLDGGVEISHATRASIRLRTLLGTKYVNLEDPGAGRPLGKGEVIPLAQTEMPADVDETLNALHKTTANADVEALNGVLNPLAEALDGRGKEIRSLLGDLDKLAGTLGGRKEQIDTLAAATDRLSGAVDDRAESLGATIDGFATVLDTLAARRAELTRLVDGVRGLSETLTPLLRENRGTLTSFLHRTNEVAAVLDAKRDRLDLAISQLAPLGERFTRITGQGAWISIYFVGMVPGPYVANPIDLGSNHGMEPGKTGGLPRLWVNPPASAGEQEAGGTEVDNDDDDVPPPPQGYPGR